MSTHAQIAHVYHQDQRHPYYSLQGGRNPERISPGRVIELRRDWVWGHFQGALQRAIDHLRSAA